LPQNRTLRYGGVFRWRSRECLTVAQFSINHYRHRM
jgi:hypothetical protein